MVHRLAAIFQWNVFIVISREISNQKSKWNDKSTFKPSNTRLIDFTSIPRLKCRKFQFGWVNSVSQCSRVFFIFRLDELNLCFCCRKRKFLYIIWRIPNINVIKFYYYVWNSLKPQTSSPKYFSYEQNRFSEVLKSH